MSNSIKTVAETYLREVFDRYVTDEDDRLREVFDRYVTDEDERRQIDKDVNKQLRKWGLKRGYVKPHGNWNWVISVDKTNKNYERFDNWFTVYADDSNYKWTEISPKNDPNLSVFKLQIYEKL